MSTDPTLLQTAAEDVLAVLTDAATDVGWTIARACVTVGEPGWVCDAIHVWPSAITPVQDQAGPNCHIVPRVSFSYGIGVCIGADRNEGCTFWNEHDSSVHDKVWAMEVALLQAAQIGLCGNGRCEGRPRFDPMTLVSNQGTMVVWIGSVQIDLRPVEL